MTDQVAVRCVYRSVQWGGQAFALCVGIDRAGTVHGLEYQGVDFYAPTAKVMIDRAVTYLREGIKVASQAGFLAADMLRDLPDHPAFEIERRVLQELASVQMITNPTLKMVAASLGRTGGAA